MIISKTPVRISFFGGGTDYPDYFRQNGGAVLSSSIDKYTFITVKSLKGLSDYKYRIAYSKLEQCNDIEEIVHPVVKACIKFLDISDNLEISVISDLPARTGIGSSSSFTVGLLNALYALRGKMIPQKQLAEEAIYVEQTLLNERVGVQDQYAAAVGGLNFMEFRKDSSAMINPVCTTSDRIAILQDHLILFYTGISRYAHQILEEQLQKTKENKLSQDLARMRKMVDEGLDILCSNTDIRLFGELLHEGWIAKRGLSSAISNNFIDDIYARARAAGALGGKLLGAGGGGFFVFFAEKKYHRGIKKALGGCHEVPFRFETDGTRIVFLS